MALERRHQQGAQRIPNAELQWWKERFIAVGLDVYLVLSVVLLGGVPWNVVLALATVAAVSAALLGTVLRRSWTRISTVCALLAVWTALSAIPLPPDVVRFLAPETFEFWSTALRPLGQTTPGWPSLSLDPAASWLEAAKWGSYAWLATVGSWVARRFGLSAVLIGVWGGAVLLGFVTFFQALSGLDTVLGLYEPIAPKSSVRITTLFINPNNLAAYSNLGVFCGLGLTFSRQKLIGRPVAAAGVVICLATLALSSSRGGFLWFLVGVALLGAMTLAERIRLPSLQKGRFTDFAPAIALLGVGSAVVAFTGSERVSGQFRDGDVSKIQDLFSLAPAVSYQSWVGVGRGAFETVSFVLAGDSRNIVRQSIESFPLSWVMEWGLPVGATAVLAFMWILRPSSLRLASGRSAAASYVALLVFAGQNLLDLGFEVFSLTAAAFTVAGALDGTRFNRGRDDAAPNLARSVPQWVPWALAALILLGVGNALFRGPDVFTLRHRLSRVLTDQLAADRALYPHVIETLRKQMIARPSEPFFHLFGSAVNRSLGHDALPWAASALQRAPQLGRAHLAVGDALLQRRASNQALFEFRIAAQADPILIDETARRVAALTTDWSLIQRARPAGESGADFLLEVRKHTPGQHTLLRRQLLDEAVSVAPDNRQVTTELGFELLADLGASLDSCRNGPIGPCSEEASTNLRRRIHTLASGLRNTDRCVGQQIAGQLLALDGKSKEAVEYLSICKHCEQPEDCAALRVRLAQGLEFHVRREAEQSYVALSCVSSRSCAGAEDLLGRLAMARRDWIEAYGHFVRAASRQATRKRWLSAAMAASRAGRPANAELAYRQAKTLGGPDERVEKMVQEARRRAWTP